MKNLYILFAVAYGFIVLTSYALDELFGIDKGIFAFIFIFGALYIMDIVIESHLHKTTLSRHNLSQSNRIKLSAFAGGIWIVIEVLFLMIDLLIQAPTYFFENIGLALNPMFLVFGCLIGIAVYSSLGYGHDRKGVEEKPTPAPPKDKADIYLKNRDTKIDIAKAIEEEKQRHRP